MPWLRQAYWIGWVQFVPPAMSALISPAWSMQKPRWPDLPTDCGTAVASYEVYMSWLLTVTLVQLTSRERVAGLLSRGQITRSTWAPVGLGGPELASPPSAGSAQAKPLEGKLVWYWICAWQMARRD